MRGIARIAAGTLLAVTASIAGAQTTEGPSWSFVGFELIEQGKSGDSGLKSSGVGFSASKRFSDHIAIQAGLAQIESDRFDSGNGPATIESDASYLRVAGLIPASLFTDNAYLAPSDIFITLGVISAKTGLGVGQPANGERHESLSLALGWRSRPMQRLSYSATLANSNVDSVRRTDFEIGAEGYATPAFGLSVKWRTNLESDLKGEGDSVLFGLFFDFTGGPGIHF